MNRKLIVAVAFILLLNLNRSWGQTIEVSLNSKATHRGKPVYWDQGFVALMEGDGRIVTFSPSEAAGFRKLSGTFQSFTQSELRGQLMREFGRSFDVSGTGQYLVVHPAGQRDRWAERFEQLYRSMVHYFRARGFQTERPEFPFTAVVFPTKAVYENYMRKNDVKIGFSSLGYYDPTSNRIHLYDVTAGRDNSPGWYLNAETIIHEAAHQTAYNIGIHRRYGDAPMWIVEGVGTMFETPGVWDASRHPLLKDRVNRQQLQNYRRLITASNSLTVLQRQITSNDLFDANSTAAYAHAWAMTFFLTELEPGRFAELIRKVNRHQAFTAYTPKNRLADFQSIFGSDLRMFAARMHRFVDSL